jgi:hypothetical protein
MGTGTLAEVGEKAGNIALFIFLPSFLSSLLSFL